MGTYESEHSVDGSEVSVELFMNEEVERVEESEFGCEGGGE